MPRPVTLFDRWSSLSLISQREAHVETPYYSRGVKVSQHEAHVGAPLWIHDSLGVTYGLSASGYKPVPAARPHYPQ